MTYNKPSRPGDTGLDAVTGAFSYSGRAITQVLLTQNRRVRTLTGHPERRPADSPIEVRSLSFDDEAALVSSLEGVTTLFNTYWVRFAHGKVNHDVAVANSQKIFAAARRAGVQKIVHTSITNPSSASPYPYFRGKALVEEALHDSGVSYVVLRPSAFFGGDGVLINNIAWLLRKLPVFAIGGDGQYRVRSMHVDDFADLAWRVSRQSGNSVANAVGPDRPTFNDIVAALKDTVHSRSVVVHVPGSLVIPVGRVLGWALHDVLLTKEEFESMSDGLADVDGESTGPTSLLAWITAHGSELGRTYANEIDRHFSKPANSSR